MENFTVKIYPTEEKVINVNDPSELMDWCSTLKCYDFELKHAVYRVGNYYGDVKKYLNRE
jgi:Protein of unknown function (DUF3606)